METVTSVEVVVDAMIENIGDIFALARGLIAHHEARKMILSQAIVDTRAVFLHLPSGMMRRLGLENSDPVRLTIQGRTSTMEVREIPDGQLPGIGHTILTSLDLVLDAPNRRLIGNPAHGGEWILELYYHPSDFASSTA